MSHPFRPGLPRDVVWACRNPYIYSGIHYSLVLSNYDPVQTTLFDKDTCLGVSSSNRTRESKYSHDMLRNYWL